MARSAAASSDAMHMNAGVLTAWPYGSLAVCLYQTTTTPFGGSGIVVVGGFGAGETAELNQPNTAATKLEYWNSTDGNARQSSTATLQVGVWSIVAVTKATGSVLARFHAYRWDTATWVHENAPFNQVDSSVTGLTEHSIGSWDAGSTGPFDYAAAAVWNQRVLTDSEIERLPHGLWSMMDPTVCWEFPSGTDFPAEVNVDHSRFRSAKQASVGASVTRTARRDPPGFRFSASTRRR